MSRLKNIATFFVLPLVMVVVFVGSANLSYGQETTNARIFITWRGESYVPWYYPGKIFPTPNSSIMASVMVVENDRLVDVSQKTIYWYANDELFDGGVGKQTASFLVPPSFRGRLDIRAKIADYSDTDILVHTITVPVPRPEVVIEIATPLTALVNTVRAYARPFFFAAKDPSLLGYEWAVAGGAPQNRESPEFVDVSLGTPGRTIPLALRISNSFGPYPENGSISIVLRTAP